MLRRTPCIGICSTTYGDLVCRGCKRFAHEVVGWNVYDEDQRGLVWARLLNLRTGATGHVLEIADPLALADAAAVVDATAPADAIAPPGIAAADPHLLAYETLQRHVGHLQVAAPLLERLGIRARDPGFTGTVADLLRLIDQECYRRSLAQYERNFRTPAE